MITAPTGLQWTHAVDDMLSRNYAGDWAWIERSFAKGQAAGMTIAEASRRIQDALALRAPPPEIDFSKP